MRDFLRQFMLYTRAERRAVVTLVSLIVFVLVIPHMYRFYTVHPEPGTIDSATRQEVTLLNQVYHPSIVPQQDTAPKEGTIDIEPNKLFNFDPNTIETEEWIKLGLTARQAAVIEKYLAKGGKFRNPDDLRKIYVLSDDMKDNLVPYVRIKTEETAIRKREIYRIDVNTADSAAYEALPGIGPVLSSRIVHYREALGGFYNLDQVGEAFGVSDSTFSLIKPHLYISERSLRLISINTADYETLRKHPYIKARIAKGIVGYRDNNGNFDSLEELKQLKAVTDQVFTKLKPYLTL